MGTFRGLPLERDFSDPRCLSFLQGRHSASFTATVQRPTYVP